MAENQFLSVLRVWAALAWADGVITDEEAESFEFLVDRADLTKRERKVALRWLESRVELDTRNIETTDLKTREGIYEIAARMVIADYHIADEEIALLARLRTCFAISDERGKQLDAKVAGLALAPRRRAVTSGFDERPASEGGRSLDRTEPWLVVASRTNSKTAVEQG